VEQVGLESQKSDDLRAYATPDGPLAPVGEIGFEIEVNEAVPKRAGH
jgi:hypothetical protein